MKTLRILSLLLVGLLVMSIGYVYAAGEDSDVETSNVSLTIPHAAKLVISQADSSKTLTQDGDAETDFDQGYTDMSTGRPNLKVSANKTWKLSAKSSGFAANDSYTKAVGDLQLKHSGNYATGGFASFTSLSATDQDIAVNTIGVKNENYDCQYRILLDYTKDIPGTYTATVTYTLATQS
jgi:hypothetical protein